MSSNTVFLQQGHKGKVFPGKNVGVKKGTPEGRKQRQEIPY